MKKVWTGQEPTAWRWNSLRTSLNYCQCRVDESRYYYYYYIQDATYFLINNKKNLIDKIVIQHFFSDKVTRNQTSFSDSDKISDSDLKRRITWLRCTIPIINGSNTAFRINFQSICIFKLMTVQVGYLLNISKRV